MASKRRPINQANPKLNYRPSMERVETKGTKPTTDPTSVKEIMTLMVLYVCKQIIFYNTYRKVAIYLGCLFLMSLIADVATVPKTFLSYSDNIFNQYFVKYAWGWNLVLLLPYVSITSYIYCCGQKDRMIKHHLSRVGIATFFWWMWTYIFNLIEVNMGKCNMKGDQYNNKQGCLKAGHFWNGFDISGHSFILIYGCLVLIEESRSVVNWDSIKDNLRLEDHYRATRDTSHNTNPLRSLTKEQFAFLQLNYEKYTPYIRGLFIAITTFTILWDFMLIGTMMYYHIMVEKLLGGLIAIVTWFITYQVWYPSNYLPKLPGNGIFKYMKGKTEAIPKATRRRTGSIVNGNQPTFMGRPLYPNRSEGNVSDVEDGAR